MFLLSYQFEIKTSVLVFAMIICEEKNEKLVKYHPGGELNLVHRRLIQDC